MKVVLLCSLSTLAALVSAASPPPTYLRKIRPDVPITRRSLSSHDNDKDGNQSGDGGGRQGRNNDGSEGVPDVLELDNGDCVGFDKEESGEQATTVDCDDAPDFCYHGSLLLKLDGTDLCLKKAGDNNNRLELDKCDNNDHDQHWDFVRAPVSRSSTIYRLMHEQSGKFLERDGDALRLDDDAPHNEDQWIVDLDADFFEMD